MWSNKSYKRTFTILKHLVDNRFLLGLPQCKSNDLERYNEKNEGVITKKENKKNKNKDKVLEKDSVAIAIDIHVVNTGIIIAAIDIRCCYCWSLQ
ncbi:Hypothetical predicted protein [Octopus vulgaris]|uniref:Uncharacterized protein n=1 Tax=Octopus vulgaris TaxID=6645 RepID=A0AA36B9J0_OCTVU|nr:Hypothetical predicted protein [Octopus vulgaris]